MTHYKRPPVPSTLKLIDAAPLERLETGTRAVVEIVGYPDGQMRVVLSRVEGPRGSRRIAQADFLMFLDVDEAKDALDLLADRVAEAAASSARPGPAVVDDKLVTRIRQLLDEGHGPDTVLRLITGANKDAAVHSAIIVEKTKREGTYRTVSATPSAVAAARDSGGHKPRWKELAAMVYGDASNEFVAKVRALYEEEHGPGSASRSWTGRGRKPSGWTE